jgi:HEAT repeat protein
MTRATVRLTARLAALDKPEDRPAREQLILEALADRSTSVREVAVAWAARCLEPGLLVPLVADAADAAVRNAALAALERQGPYAVGAVERLTNDPDADLAMFACQVLGTIGGPTSIEPLMAALARPEVNVVQAATEALGRLKAVPAVPALVKLLERDAWLQLAAVDALGAIGDPSAVEPLLRLVPDSFVAETALDALRRIGSPTVLPALFPLMLESSRASLRDAMLDAAGAALVHDVRPEVLHAMGQAVESDHAPGSLWHFLAERLSGVGITEAAVPDSPPCRDDRGERRGGTARVRSAGALALALEVPSLLPLVVRWAASKDGAGWIRPMVVRFVVGVEHCSTPTRVGVEHCSVGAEQCSAPTGLLANPDARIRAGCVRAFPPGEIGVGPLMQALDDPEVEVRVAAADALGELGDALAAEPLAVCSESEIATERAAALRALARMPAASLEPILGPWLEEGSTEPRLIAALTVLGSAHVEGLEARVLELAANTLGSIKRLALHAVATIPGSRAEVLLLRALADRDPSLQVESLDLLVGRGGRRVVTTLLALLNVSDSLRYHVIRALGHLEVERAAEPLMALFPTAPLHEQLEILGALGRLGVAESRPFLYGRLTHPQKEIRRAAAQALVDLAEPSDLEMFRGLAGDADWVLRGEAARALGRLDLPEARETLLDLVRDLEPTVAHTARTALADRP